MIWDALLRLWRSMLQRVRGIPRSLPSGDDDVEDPIPLTWRDVELRELGRDVGRDRQRPTVPVPRPPRHLPPPPLPAVSIVPTLRPLPSGMPSRKPRRPGH